MILEMQEIFLHPPFPLTKKGLHAILHGKYLQLELPNTKEELDELAEGFKCKSTEGIINGWMHRGTGWNL